MNIYFVRHGYALHNFNYKLIGYPAYYDIKNEDAPLILEGINQAIEAGNKLKNIDFDIIFSSPLTRCIQTTDLMVNNKNIFLDDLLLETQGSHISNKRKQKKELEFYCKNLKNKYNLEFLKDNYLFSPDNIIERNIDFYKFLVGIKKENFKNILVVSHFDWIKSFFKNILNINYEPSNCEIKKIII